MTISASEVFIASWESYSRVVVEVSWGLMLGLRCCLSYLGCLGAELQEKEEVDLKYCGRWRPRRHRVNRLNLCRFSDDVVADQR